MKYTIPQERFKHVIFQYLDNKFDSFTKVYSVKFYLGYFYVLGTKIMAEIIPQQNAVILDYDLFEDVMSTFSFGKTSEFQFILKEWAENRFGMENPVVDYHAFVENVNDL